MLYQALAKVSPVLGTENGKGSVSANILFSVAFGAVWCGLYLAPMNQQLQEISRLLCETHGRDVSCFDAAFFQKSLDKRMAATSLNSVSAYGQRLREDPAETAEFMASLQIAYSEFFRNPLTFAVLEQLVLPALAGAKNVSAPHEIRVWSAGCAAGQEAWSIAILIEELAAARKCPVPFLIIATDVSEAELALARRGVYDAAAVQNVRLIHLRDYFTAQGDCYLVAPRLRGGVDFSAYDLLDENSASPPTGLYGDFDLIFCCNLLFYYRPEIRQRILDKMWRALAPGGYFVTGEAERDIVMRHSMLSHVALPAAVFQKPK